MADERRNTQLQYQLVKNTSSQTGHGVAFGDQVGTVVPNLIAEIAEETHRSKRSVERYTKETRDKMKSKQMELDLEEKDFFNIGEIDENGMIEVKVGRFVTYFAKEDIPTLVKRLVEKIDKLEGNE